MSKIIKSIKVSGFKSGCNFLIIKLNYKYQSLAFENSMFKKFEEDLEDYIYCEFNNFMNKIFPNNSQKILGMPSVDFDSIIIKLESSFINYLNKKKGKEKELYLTDLEKALNSWFESNSRFFVKSEDGYLFVNEVNWFSNEQEYFEFKKNPKEYLLSLTPCEINAFKSLFLSIDSLLPIPENKEEAEISKKIIADELNKLNELAAILSPKFEPLFGSDEVFKESADEFIRIPKSLMYPITIELDNSTIDFNGKWVFENLEYNDAKYSGALIEGAELLVLESTTDGNKKIYKYQFIDSFVNVK